MSSPYLSPTLRKQIAEKSHYRCVYCLTSQHIIGPLLEIDHIIPQAKGGQHNIENLCLACNLRSLPQPVATKFGWRLALINLALAVVIPFN